MTRGKARPSGLVKLGFKVPTWLYRAHLGFLFGGRVFAIVHHGRTSGKRYVSGQEVLLRRDGELFVFSAWGTKADWFPQRTRPPRHRQANAAAHARGLRIRRRDAPRAGGGRDDRRLQAVVHVADALVRTGTGNLVLGSNQYSRYGTLEAFGCTWNG